MVFDEIDVKCVRNSDSTSSDFSSKIMSCLSISNTLSGDDGNDCFRLCMMYVRNARRRGGASFLRSARRRGGATFILRF